MLTEAAIRDALAEIGERWATGSRVGWLTRLTHAYAAQGVLGDWVAPPLQECCPSASTCWARLGSERRQRPLPLVRGRGENQSIFWPWIGGNYRPNGVCVLSLNLNHEKPKEWNGLAAEYSIAGKVFAAWEAGRKAVWHHSAFHWRLTASALAVIASMDGERPSSKPTLAQTTEAYDRIARVQAVKCAPRLHRSAPAHAMKHECPPRFAANELSILQPSVIVALGSAAGQAVERLGDLTSIHHGLHLSHRSLDMNGRRMAVFQLPHPSARGNLWPAGQDELVAHLIDEPLD